MPFQPGNDYRSFVWSRLLMIPDFFIPTSLIPDQDFSLDLAERALLRRLAARVAELAAEPQAYPTPDIAPSEARGARRKCSSMSSDRASQTATPRTLMPRTSRGGENTPMPS